MADGGFHQTSPVKRKPLPRDSRHSRTIWDRSSQDDSFPLRPIDDRLSWSLPPLTDFNDTNTTYEVPKKIDLPKATQGQWDGPRQRWNRGGRYFRLSPPDRWVKFGLSQKFPFVFQNAGSPGDVDEVQSQPQMWNPIWLQGPILSGFVALFLALVAGLLILWHFAQLRNGIRTNITNNHYAWTYGPTALLVVIGVAWKQVDFHCRTLAPWAHLRDGPAAAKQSLLLDYISPILPKILAAAATNRDWPVVASGIGILLLRLVIVFSTGLLVLTPTSDSKITPDVIVNSKFVGTNSSIAPVAVDTELMRYYGIQERGLDYQYGTSASVAYNTLDLHSVPVNSTVAATVDGVFPFFDCEIVTPNIVGNNFTWSNDGEYPYGDTLDLGLTLYPDRCPPLRSYYQLCSHAPDCPLGRSIISDESWNWPNSYNPMKPLDDLDPCANLYYLTIIDITFAKVAGHPSNSSEAWNVTLADSVGMVCALGYTVDRVNITINTADPTSSGGVNTTGPLQRIADVLPGFSYYNLTQDFQNQVTVNGLPALTDAPKIYDFAHLFAILNGGSATALLNGTTLRQTAEKAFKGVAVQFAHSYLRKADNVTTTAEVMYQEPRLQIRMVSLWAMGAGCVLLAFSAAAVLRWRPQDVVSRRPNSIAAQATILAASPTLQRSLEAAASDSVGHLKPHLQDLLAASHITSERGGREFSIETTVKEGNQARSPDDSSKDTWWKTMSSTVWFMCMALALPLGVIVTLEVLQHESDMNDGLATMSSRSSITHSLPTILTSLILISIAMMYDTIDFAAGTLAPYQMLARGGAPAKQTLMDTSGNPPIWSTVKSIRERHMGAAVASAAALVGSLLTIIASGLYTIEAVPLALDVTISTSDKFVPSFGTSTDGSAGAMFQLIEQNNASYPALTYDGLAYPSIDISSLGAEAMGQLRDPAQSVTLQANIVAMRASLNCTLVPRHIMNMTMVGTRTPGCRDNVLTFNASLPSSCPHFLNGQNETATDIPFTYSVQHNCLDEANLAIYEQVVLNAEGATGEANFMTSEGDTLGAASNPPGCPSLAFLSGYFVENVTSTENITAMTCIQGLEEVHTETVFSVTVDAVQVRSEPKVDESSARWLQAFNSTYWFTNINTFGAFDREAPTLLIDYFYSQVNYGPDGIPAQELTGPANTQRFIDATQRIYRRYMAQLISATMRQTLNRTETASAPGYSGTVSGLSRPRLKQDPTSKLILQIFLGIMLACGVFVYSRRNMHRVLPRAPWSIAGMMSLLAGSEMIDRKVIPIGAAFMSDKELAKVFQGYVFSLGWWETMGDRPNGPETARRFGIDIGKAETSAKA
ncbi:hypothetical protein A1O3_07978 [Capronia epimyces CBS 606.96]|uniref:Uncharacterized protein n=1 Tax=Capronia epimyces CBS 606.96 TaxID=1182542 RepID=W9XRS8_9EURO|nr:uncharacterized protein A1O3_07978 [Capronia epimyces CBS 606.96]EXJ79696.1 hypothetical protein A1O3_07978 [Capronia epimyces CBS 606.96]